MNDRQSILAGLRTRPLTLATLRDAIEAILLDERGSGRYRLNKRQLAEQRAVTQRTIDRWKVQSILPPRDVVNGRDYWWSDALARHDNRIRSATKTPPNAGKPRPASTGAAP